MNQGDQHVAIARWINGNAHGAVSVRHPPSYTRSIEEAIGLCRILANMGWRCIANMGLDGTWECFFTKNNTRLSIIPAEGDHYGSGDTLAVALSEAFLRTVGKWKEDPSTS